MAEPARNELQPDDPPLTDPGAIDRAYRQARARRRAKIEHRKRAKHASLRFWLVFWILLFLSVVLALFIWSQMQQLFGL